MTFREGILVISTKIINIPCDLAVPLLENYPTDVSAHITNYVCTWVEHFYHSKRMEITCIH